MMCFNIRFRFSNERRIWKYGNFLVLHFHEYKSQDLVLNSASDMCPKEMLNTQPRPRPPDLLASNYHNEGLVRRATGIGRAMQKGFIDVILSFLWRIFITVAHHLLLFIPGPLTTHIPASVLNIPGWYISEFAWDKRGRGRVSGNMENMEHP